MDNGGTRISDDNAGTQVFGAVVPCDRSLEVSWEVSGGATSRLCYAGFDGSQFVSFVEVRICRFSCTRQTVAALMPRGTR